MSRRRKTNGADAVTDLVAKLPWWVGVVLAIVAYVVLHRLAAPLAVAPLRPGQAGALVVRTIIQAMASVGQYLVPAFCLIGAGLSAYRQRERRGLVDRVTQNPAADMLNGMSWRQFEKMVGEAFRLQGYAVKETGGGGADGGVDLRLTRNGETYLVQCKQWRALRVGVDVVRELYGVMAAEGAAGGFVVTSGRFTEEAAKFAAGRNVTLVNGEKMRLLIQQKWHPKI
jgi:restriction system protein